MLYRGLLSDNKCFGNIVFSNQASYPKSELGFLGFWDDLIFLD
jgi:hypothetical protein